MTKLSDNEIKRTTKLLPEKRYAYSLEKIIKNQFVYVLEREVNGYASSEIEGNRLVAIWPSKEYATLNARADWEDFRPKEIALASIEPLLEAIESEGWNLDVFPNGAKTGLVVTVDEFINDLNAMVNNTAEE